MNKCVFMSEFTLICLLASYITDTLFNSVTRTPEHSEQNQNLFAQGFLLHTQE